MLLSIEFMTPVYHTVEVFMAITLQTKCYARLCKFVM